MKRFITILLLFTAIIMFAADLTNGFVYVDKVNKYNLISHSGAIETNVVVAGKTMVVSDKIVEFLNATNTTFYFAGGPTINTSTNSEFSVNLYEIEIINPKESRKAIFGKHNLNLLLNRGDFSIIYTNSNEQSYFVIATPFTTYELGGGKYFFRVTDKSSVAYVLEGTMNIHGDKKVDKTSKGNIAVAVPYDDPVSGVTDKVVTSMKQLKQEETLRFAAPVLAAEKQVENIEWYVVDGKAVGIWKN